MTRTPSFVSLLLAGGLMLLAAIQPAAALAQDLAVASAPGTAASAPAPPEPALITILGWPVSPDLLVRGTSSIIGIVVFNVVMTSLTAVPAAGAAAATPLATVLANRIVASSLAATAAVGTMFAYDKWTGRAMDYDYAWSRAGFVAGATAASAVLTGLGYSAGAWWTATWAANRAALVGAGLLGGWSARRWHPGQ